MSRRKPPLHDDGRNVRGCSLTCDDCGDQLELRAHGLGVRGELAPVVGAKMAEALHELAEAMGWHIRPRRVTPGDDLSPLTMRHSCPRCAAASPTTRSP